MEEQGMKKIENVPLSKWKLLKDKFEAMKECQITYRSDVNVLQICGDNVVNSKYYSDIIELLEGIKTGSLELTMEERKLLRRDEVTELLDNMCEQDLHSTSYEIKKDSLIVYSVDSIDDKVEMVKDRFLHSQTFQLPEGIDMARLREVCSKCTSMYLVTMKWNHPPTELNITGVSDDIYYAKIEVGKVLADYTQISKTFTLKGKEAIFVKKHQMKSLETLFKNAQVTKRESDSDQDILFEFSCQKLHMRELNNDLDHFRENIIKSEVDLKQFQNEDLALICMNLNDDTNFVKIFERDYSCCVFVEGNDSNEFFVVTEKKVNGYNHGDSADITKTKTKDKNNSGKAFSLSSSCKLQILSAGNIIKEETELLVCGVDENLDMKKAYVSRAFLQLDSTLEKEIENYKFSSNGVCIKKRSLPGTKCKAVAFITLKTWQQGVSDQRLSAAITEVLETAKKMKLRSISFPPLGHGRAFRFPVKTAAQIVVQTISLFDKKNSSGSNIELINILGPDRQFFAELINVIDSMSDIKQYVKDESDSDDCSNSDKEEETLQTEMQMEALTPKKSPHITIISAGNNDIKSKFIDAMKRQWLFEETFKADRKSQFINDVFKMAEKLGVWVSKYQHQSAELFSVKGNREAVHEMKQKGLELYQRHGQIKENLFSSSAPRRGTIDFIEHAVNCDDCLPSYWGNDGRYHLVDVDSKTFNAIQNLVVQTWDTTKVGFGKDAHNIPKKSDARVIRVQRLENHILFKKYSMKRKLILNDMCARNRVCQDVEQLPKSKGPVQVMEILPEFMKKELLHEINEYYLFHGTKEATVKAICKQGIDCRLSNLGAMFGQGVYTAESSTKADQYTDDINNRLPQGSNLTMMLTRVAMGEVFLCDDQHESVQSIHSKKLRRPPCLTCSKDLCDCGDDLYHSVMGNGKWIFREFVVYDKDQCYPEYVITYQRV